jgi:hypothetical protein
MWPDHWAPEEASVLAVPCYFYQHRKEADLTTIGTMLDQFHSRTERNEEMIKREKSSTRSHPPRILQIAYSPIVLATRQMLLEAHGYSVRSVLGNKEAFALAAEGNTTFDIVLIGHGAEIDVRRQAARLFKEKFPGVRVIALRSDYFVGEVKEADYNSDVDKPQDWLSAVDKLAA